MPETLKRTNTGEMWLATDILGDLVLQGGLDGKDIILYPLLTKPHSFQGEYQNSKFRATWYKDQALLLGMENLSPDLVRALSKVVGYLPYCKYDYRSERGLVSTVEWNKENPDEQFNKIQNNPKYTGLVRIKSLEDLELILPSQT